MAFSYPGLARHHGEIQGPCHCPDVLQPLANTHPLEGHLFNGAIWHKASRTSRMLIPIDPLILLSATYPERITFYTHHHIQGLFLGPGVTHIYISSVICRLRRGGALTVPNTRGFLHNCWLIYVEYGAHIKNNDFKAVLILNEKLSMVPYQ